MKNILAIILSVVIFYSCSKDNNDEVIPQDNVSINNDTIYFDSNANSQQNTISITSSGDWRLAGKKTWCTPSVVEGKSGATISFTAEANNTNTVRSIVYSFVCGSQTAKLVVIQKQNSVFEMMTGATYQVVSSDSKISVRVNTNIDLNIEIPENSKWISNTYPYKKSSGGVEENWLTFSIKGNDTYKARTGKIIIKGEGIENQEIIVNQPQNDAIILGQASYNVTPSGATITVNVQTNVPYTVSIPSAKQSWITKTSTTSAPTVEGLNSFQETFDVGAVGTVSRVAQITFAGGAASSVTKFFQLSANPVYTAIPDSNFRSYLETNDYAIVLDKAAGTCVVAEAGSTATSFSVTSRRIKSLEGIGAFTLLRTLYCSTNYITVLDVSQNTALTTLSCTGNNLNKIILGDVNITSLSFSSTSLRNPDLVYSTELTILSNKLRTFTCSSTNLVTLDVSECPALTSLTCNSAASLTTLYLKTGQDANLTTFRKSDATTVIYK